MQDKDFWLTFGGINQPNSSLMSTEEKKKSWANCSFKIHSRRAAVLHTACEMVKNKPNVLDPRGGSHFQLSRAFLMSLFLGCSWRFSLILQHRKTRRVFHPSEKRLRAGWAEPFSAFFSAQQLQDCADTERPRRVRRESFHWLSAKHS